jgi:hypothetical protein
MQAQIVQDYALQELRWNIPISKEYSRVHNVVETVLDPPTLSAKMVAKKLASREKKRSQNSVTDVGSWKRWSRCCKRVEINFI